MPPPYRGLQFSEDLMTWFSKINASDDPPAGPKLADKCKAKLTTPAAQQCKLGDLWRLQGWRLGNESPVLQGSLKDLKLDDLRQIADAFEVLINHPDFGGPGAQKWKYRPENVFTCCCCPGCCDVVALPKMVC